MGARAGRADGERPNAARMYDYFLGGKDNYAVDRELARKLLKKRPEVAVVARENRRFLGRAVRYLAAECGVRQFIDIGTGIPARGNTHEVARSAAPDSRVVYVDNDPVVLAYARALLARDASTVAVRADLREPETILDAPAVRGLIDFTEPVALLFVAVLHFIQDEDGPYDLVARYRDAVPAGSYLVVSHAEDNPNNAAAKATYSKSTSQAAWRDRPAIERFFTGWDVLDPGVVYVHEWRPTGDEEPSDLGLCGVGHKTG